MKAYTIVSKKTGQAFSVTGVNEQDAIQELNHLIDAHFTIETVWIIRRRNDHAMPWQSNPGKEQEK